MKSVRQLLRQPLKTCSGILLVALAVAVLCVSFSQTLAAAQTAAMLKTTFITVALPTSMDTEAETWVEHFASENPDIIQEDLRHGLASAYIPALTQDNLTDHLYEAVHMNDNYTKEPEHPVYSGAMLEITLTGIGTDGSADFRYRPTSDGTGLTASLMPYGDGYGICLEGTVNRVLGLQEGYHDPTGYSVKLYLHVADEQEFLDMGLTVGERYLVYSEEYLDLDWLLRSNLVSTGRVIFWEDGVEIPYWSEKPQGTTQVIDWDAFNASKGGMPSDFTVTRYRYRIGDLIYTVDGVAAEMFRTAELTLENMAAIPLVDVYYTMEGDTVVEHRDELDAYTYWDADGNEQIMSLEDYKERYETPTIVHLEGSAEEFLASPEGALWQQALEDITVNASAFPVIGVDDLRSYADFASGKAAVTEGREFTQEELSNGAKVCIISKTLAQASGLGVGDTVSASFFTYDYADPCQSFIRDGDGIINPTAYRFRSETMELGPEEVYTIIGLYEQNSPWGNVDNNFFQFTPNTIFAPKASITGSMDHSNNGMFRTFVLDGDRLYDMQMLTVEAGYDGTFYYYDNGYTNLANSLKGYQQASSEILPLGLLVYGVLMVLYLFLFPGRQGKDLTMMDSFGATTFRRMTHIVLSCAGVLVPGSVLGTAAGIHLWQYVSDALSAYMETGVEITLDVDRLWMVCGIQVILVVILAAVMGAVMSARVNYMKRK